MTPRAIIPAIVATLTRHPREIRPLEIYPESWTGTCFRVWEWIAGRRSGIRRYNAVEFKTVDGVQTRIVKFFCFEALVCYGEVLLREWLQRLGTWEYWIGFNPMAIRIYYAQAANGVALPSPYLFAIARDTSSTFGGGTGTTTVTYTNYPMAATSSGALFFAMYGVNGGSDTVTAQTFNAVSMTKINVGVPAYRQAYLFYQLGATGTHNIVITFSADPGGSDGSGFSYTGCSTSAIDSTNTATGSGISDLALTTTVVASNCWIVIFCLDNTSGTQSGGAGLSLVQSGGANFRTYDTNGTVSTGSVTLHVTSTASGGAMGGCIASFAPTVAVTALPLRALMGVGK